MDSINHINNKFSTLSTLQFGPVNKSDNKQDINTPTDQISRISDQIMSIPENTLDKSTVEISKKNNSNSNLLHESKQTIKNTGRRVDKHSYLKEYLINHRKGLPRSSKSGLKDFEKEVDTNLELSSGDNLKIHVDGIPTTGAKSRVETQIKLSIHLLDDHGSKVPNWSYLRIDHSQLAKSKLRKSQNNKFLDESLITMPSEESRVLNLEAQVICESNENKIIKMCQGCVRRERKRSERKKNIKLSFNNAPVATDSSVADEAFERDRLRVLLFNCEPLINFSSGEAVIPTRITCYCRHHNERIGFRIRFAMRNSNGVIVARGQSSVIMITDDHKSSKQRALDRKKRDTKYDLVSKNEIIPDPHPSQTDSFFENFTPNGTPFSSRCDDSLGYFSHSRTQSAASNASSAFQNYDSPLLTPSEDSVYFGTPNMYTPPYPAHDMTNQYPSNNVLSMTQQHSVATDLSFSTVHTGVENINSPTYTNSSCTNTTNVPLAFNSLHQSLANNSFQVATENPHAVDSLYSPEIRMVSPSQGPVYGGTEITITGNGFYADLIVMFGGRSATTVCWSPTSIVCILPPTENPGPVSVSFKEHTLLENENFIFNYYDNNRQEILDLSLQAVKNKYDTNLHGNTGFVSNISSKTVHNQQNIQDHTNFQGQNFEQDILNILSHLTDASRLEQTNSSSQNILHIAVYANYSSLVAFIVARHPGLVDTQDSNGFSPLHFACLSRATDSIHILLNSSANPSLESNFGTPTFLLHEQNSLYNKDQFNSAPTTWVPYIHGIAATQYYQPKDVIMTNSSNESFENPLMIHYLDNLLYTF